MLQACTHEFIGVIHTTERNGATRNLKGTLPESYETRQRKTPD